MKRFWIIIFTIVIAVVSILLLHKQLNSVYIQKCESYYAKNNSEISRLKLKIVIVPNRIDYHHLGEEITITHKCNGAEIQSGDVINAQPTLSFTTTIIEHDSINDVGKRSISFILPPINTTKTMSITVHEKGGTRYPNAYATWDITYSIEPVFNIFSVDCWHVFFS